MSDKWDYNKTSEDDREWVESKASPGKSLDSTNEKSRRALVVSVVSCERGVNSQMLSFGVMQNILV